MAPLSLNCLGTGDGWPGADRFHSAFLYRFPRATFLIDCGEPVSRSYKAGAWSYELVDRVFLSHLHFDHVGGFFMLMQAFWLEARRRLLTVHLPHDGVEPVTRMLEAGCIFPELFRFRLRFEALVPGKGVTTKGVRVVPFRTTHLGRLRASFRSRYTQRFESFCFLLEGNGLRVAHSADLGAVDDLEPLLQKPVDLLVCELAHFEVESVTAYVRSRPVRRVLFVHLERGLREDLGCTRRRLKAGLGGIPFSIARDGDEVKVGPVS